MKFKKIYYEEIDSTNKELERINAVEGTVIVAERQTSGKGQGGRSWISEEGGLYFSIMIKPKSNFHLIPLISGLSVFKSISDLIPNESKNINIKWPNDVFYNDMKVSGTLVESKFKGNKIDYCIVGVGINVNQDTFPILDDNKPISIKQISNRAFEKIQVLDLYLKYFSNLYLSLLDSKNIIEEVNKHLYKKNEIINISVQDKVLLGTLKGLNDDGALILLDKEDKEHIIYSGRILK